MGKYGLVWEMVAELRQAIAASPDNLPAVAAALVLAKDAQGLFGLVRDRITTVPFVEYLEPGYQSEPARLSFGPRATLRTAAGSPRDKVQLLHDLLVEAGFSAKVVLTDYAPAENEVAAHFARKLQPTLSIAVDETKLDAWCDAVGVSRTAPPAPSPLADPTGAEATALADALLGQLPPLSGGMAQARPVWRGPTPAVQVTVGGKTVLLQPLRPDATFGGAYGELIADAPEATSEVATIAVEGLWSDDLVWTLLVGGSWPEHELAGRQVSFVALPLLPPAAWLRSAIGDAISFRPLLGLQARDDAAKPLPVEKAFVGDGFSLGGDTLTVDSGGVVSVNGRALVEPGKKGPVEEVASVRVSATSLAFPRVDLRVRALDQAGAPVTSLGSGAFAVAEGGVQRGALLRANAAARRVQILMDGSGSMPEAYLDQAGQALLAGIRDDLLALDPTMEIVTELTGSDLWTALATGAGADPCAVVFITDGDVTDERTPAIERVLKVGPPVLLLDVTPDLDAALSEMAQLAGGSAKLVASPEEARQATVAFLKDAPPSAYLLSYDAPLSGPSERTVNVRVGTASGDGSYLVPVAGERVPTRRLIGLRLVATIAGTTVARDLGGYASARNDVLTWEQVVLLSDGLRATLRSPLLLTFDGEQPLPAVLADDALTLFAMHRPLYDVREKTAPTEAELLAAMRVDRAQFARSFVRMAARTPAALASRTFGGRIGLTMHGTRLALEPEQLRIARFTDVLAIPRHRSVGDLTEAEAFRATARATVHAALVESQTYATSTISALAGKGLAVREPGEIGTPPAGMTPAESAKLGALLDRYIDAFRLYAADGSSSALWVIEPRTGEVYALLGDGSGGSSEDELRAYQQSVANMEAVLELIGQVAELFNLGGVGLAVSYAQLQLALWSAATISVLGLDGSGAEEELKEAMTDAIQAAISELLGGPYGEAFSILVQVFGNASA